MRFRISTLALFACALTACGDETLISVPDPPPAPEPADPAPRVEPEPEPEPLPPPTSGDGCADDSECGDGSECEAGTCVGVGVLQVTLSFFADADYDLHLYTPSGEEIYFANPAAAGGVLDVDQCVSDCGPGTHIENIFFNGALFSGSYEAWVVNFDGRSGGNFHIEVSGAAAATLDGNLDSFPYEQSSSLFFDVP